MEIDLSDLKFKLSSVILVLREIPLIERDFIITSFQNLFFSVEFF